MLLRKLNRFMRSRGNSWSLQMVSLRPNWMARHGLVRLYVFCKSNVTSKFKIRNVETISAHHYGNASIYSWREINVKQLNEKYPAHMITSYSFQIHFNIILAFMRTLVLKFSILRFVRASFLGPTCPVCLITHFFLRKPWIYREFTNTGTRVF
jgi:hypothetical protein